MEHPDEQQITYAELSKANRPLALEVFAFHQDSNYRIFLKFVTPELIQEALTKVNPEITITVPYWTGVTEIEWDKNSVRKYIENTVRKMPEYIADDEAYWKNFHARKKAAIREEEEIEA